MASALQVLSGEEINFLRVANLLIRHSPKAVRILFDREFNPSGLNLVLSKNRIKLDKLKKKHVITKTQWSLLFPSGCLPDSSNFDLTLMVCLLRNLTKVNIHDQLPQPSDLSEGAAVSRIKFYRNQIAHSDSGTMSDSEFSKTFDEVSMAIEIICPPMKTDCKTLKDADIDHSVHDIYLEFVKNEKQMEEMKQQQEELVAQVEILNVERQNIEYIQTEEISDWKKKLEKFYVTEAATRLIKVIKENQCTIITGIPGSGKSALAYYVAIQLQETEGYTVLPIWLPSEMIKITNSNIKQLFVFDDVFGKYSLDEFNLNCWESETRRIKMLLKNKTLKVIVTCRSYLYDKVIDSLSSQLFEHFNMQSDEVTLSLVERKEISKLYLTGDVVRHLNDETVMMYNFFPLLCVMFKEKNMDNADFFQNPKWFIENEIDNFKNKRDLSFICLALLVLSNNSIEKEGLQIGKDKYGRILQDLFDELDIKKNPSKTSILLNLQHLKNMYLEETESTFCTKHDKIFDIVSLSVGNFMIRCVLRHAESAFISSRCQLTSLNEHHDDCTIMITDEFETIYFERIFRDIENGHNWEVFASIQMKFENYRHKLMQYLEKMSPKFSSSINDFTTPLHVTAAKGYFDISKYLLKQNRKHIRCLDNFKRSPLHQAAMNGHHEIAQLLIKNGARINQQDNDGYTPLLESCNNGCPIVTEVLIQVHANVNVLGNDGWYPLHIAASDGNIDLIRLLVKHKAKVNKRMFDGMTPLYIACDSGHLLAVKLLLKSKADVNKCENNGWSPINVASYSGFDDIVEVLIVNGADVNKLDNLGGSPLHKACINNHINTANALIDHGALINQVNEAENTPLHMACQHGNKEIVELLCKLGASANQRSKAGFTPLHCFCYRDNEKKNYRTITKSASLHNVNESEGVHLIPVDNSDKDIIKQLIKHGADINSATKNGKTPIFLACERDNLEEVKMLLRLEVDANKCNDNGYIDHGNEEGLTPLHVACCNGNKNIAELLIKQGAAVNKADNDGNTALLYACNNLQNEISLLLLQYGAEVNNHDQNGRTSLHSAAEDRNIDLIKILNEHDANINSQMSNGMTPIYIACEINHLAAVKMLISYKADINKCEVNGWSPLHVSSYSNHKEIVGYLCNHSDTKLNLCNKSETTPLHLACLEGNEDIVQILLKHGASINHCDEDGCTPIHDACSNGNINIVELLLKDEAAVNLPDRTGRTPLYIACQQKCKDVVELLLKHGTEVEKAAQVESKEGWTPLHVSASSGDTRITDLLLKYNATVNVEDRNGHTPLYYATQQKCDAIIELLSVHGAILSNNDVKVLSLSKRQNKKNRCKMQ